MLVQLLRKRSKVSAALLLASVTLLGACANHDEHVALVNDPDDKHDSMIPWNKQEKWETQTQIGDQPGGLTDRR